MKNLVEIIEDCKLNKIENMDKKELQYAVIAITSIANMSMSAIMQLYQKDSISKFNKMQLENIYNAYNVALNKPPKEWLGWNNDPENPEYQKFHALGTRLVNKALEGELPNQKNKVES